MGPRRIMFILGVMVFGGLLMGASDDSPSPAREVTFNRDVAPIFFKNCVVCHRPNDIAPMSLMTYKDAQMWARPIREAVVQPQDAALACRSQGGRFHQRPAVVRCGYRHH